MNNMKTVSDHTSQHECSTNIKLTMSTVAKIILTLSLQIFFKQLKTVHYLMSECCLQSINGVYNMNAWCCISDESVSEMFVTIVKQAAIMCQWCGKCGKLSSDPQQS